MIKIPEAHSKWRKHDQNLGSTIKIPEAHPIEVEARPIESEARPIESEARPIESEARPIEAEAGIHILRFSFSRNIFH